LKVKIYNGLMDMDDEKAGIKNQQTGRSKGTLFEGPLINAKVKK